MSSALDKLRKVENRVITILHLLIVFGIVMGLSAWIFYMVFG